MTTLTTDQGPEPTVFIVDDDVEVRRAMSLLVRSVGLSNACFSSAQEFLDDFDPQRPGCLILDVRMPGMSGLELQQGLHSKAIDLPIIFISAHGEIPMATQAIRAGAVDFLPKPFSPQKMLERIQEALSLDRDLRRKRAAAAQVQQRISKLTDREREIMHIMARGESTKSMATRLGISPKTVDNHRAKILVKMGVDNSTQLAHLLELLACRTATS